ncbi:DUF1707 SHOCT-like domain-containing protein [Nocardiopsis trehalosi]|jgi:hypothetical protein|uniref:DUF1707 SHOCT-like domain-containing protein n=1 Tax=Nocardiopsis trehalosi TaxID=109329 RepID=UPI0008370DCE|nr:DUF1707 domain-containing protein [Nocardiopsis trehalosi]
MSEHSPEIRVSDADRDQVAKLLQDHYAHGRLDADEFNVRLESAYTARTRGDLAPLTEDLPERDLADLPVDPARAPAPRGERRALLRDPALAIPWALWAGVNALCFTIWLILLLAEGATYPWFLWVAGPWGIVMLFVTLAVGATNRHGTGHA